MTIADILDKAADLIEPEGRWIQGSWHDRHGCVCAEMAIYQAAGCGHVRPSHPAAVFFAEQLPAPKPGKRRITHWNDAPERTQAEVVAKLREAASLARERGK